MTESQVCLHLSEIQLEETGIPRVVPVSTNYGAVYHRVQVDITDAYPTNWRSLIALRC